MWPYHRSSTLRFEWDIEAYKEIMFGPELPPQVFFRALLIYMTIYGFDDAFRKGFGSMVPWKEGIKHQVAIWEPNDNHDISSNWCDFKSIVETLEEEKKIEGSRNRLCEATLQKENLLRSPKLFNLVLRLRKLELAELREVTLFPLLGRTQSFTFPIAQESPQRQSREQTIPLAVTGERGSLKARTCSTAFLSTCLILTENQS
jgi:hypothetical protein